MSKVWSLESLNLRQPDLVLLLLHYDTLHYPAASHHYTITALNIKQPPLPNIPPQLALVGPLSLHVHECFQVQLGLDHPVLLLVLHAAHHVQEMNRSKEPEVAVANPLSLKSGLVRSHEWAGCTVTTDH